MYLSNKKTGIETHDHEELEVLLESFSKQFEEIVNESENIEARSYYQTSRESSNSSYIDQRSIDAGNCRIDIRFKS